MKTSYLLHNYDSWYSVVSWNILSTILWEVSFNALSCKKCGLVAITTQRTLTFHHLHFCYFVHITQHSHSFWIYNERRILSWSIDITKVYRLLIDGVWSKSCSGSLSFVRWLANGLLVGQWLCRFRFAQRTYTKRATDMQDNFSCIVGWRQGRPASEWWMRWHRQLYKLGCARGDKKDLCLQIS